MTENDNDWVEWKGGECPVPLNAKVQVKFFGHPDGPTSTKKAYNLLPGLWSHDPDIRRHWHIIAYRVVAA